MLSPNLLKTHHDRGDFSNYLIISTYSSVKILEPLDIYFNISHVETFLSVRLFFVIVLYSIKLYWAVVFCYPRFALTNLSFALLLCLLLLFIGIFVVHTEMYYIDFPSFFGALFIMGDKVCNKSGSRPYCKRRYDENLNSSHISDKYRIRKPVFRFQSGNDGKPHRLYILIARTRKSFGCSLIFVAVPDRCATNLAIIVFVSTHVKRL